MDENRIIEYVLLYCKGELSEQQYNDLACWIKSDKQHAEQFREWVRKCRQTRCIAFWNHIDEDQAWMVIRQKIHEPKSGFYFLWRKYGKYAAVFLLLAVCAGYFYMTANSDESVTDQMAFGCPGEKKAVLLLSTGQEINLTRDTASRWIEHDGTVIEKSADLGIQYVSQESLPEEKLAYNTISIPRGGEYFLQLADGTKVWLNAESKLVYPAAFGNGNREVVLEGEGYFEVAKDEAHPFVVKSGKRSVMVLGTKFNVSAYRTCPDLVATLVEGCVRVGNGNKNSMLSPGEQAIVGEHDILIQIVDVNAVAAWARGVFEFEDLPLGQITQQLARWYDVNFVYQDNDLRDIHFTGAARRHQDVRFILDMIERLSYVKFKNQGNQIIISKQ